MYKVIRLLRLVRVLKLQKVGTTTVRGDAHQQHRIDQASRRTGLFVFNFCIATHIFSCLWVIAG